MHEAARLNGNIRDICRRFAAQGYAALGVDLFGNRNRAVCMARMFAGAMAGKVYPGAKHAFFNDRWRTYHPAAAADSWRRVLAFFAEHVRGDQGQSRTDPGPPAPRGGPGPAAG